MAQELPGGQFGQAVGGMDALKAAMQRRGIDSSILDQVSPAGGGSPVSPNVPMETPNVTPRGASVAPPVEQAKKPFRSGEMEIALKALENTVRTENKIAESSLRLSTL